MLIVLKKEAAQKEIDELLENIRKAGYNPDFLPGAERTAIGIRGNTKYIDEAELHLNNAVKEVLHVTKPYKLVSREWRIQDTLIRLKNGVTFGGSNPPVIIAGPCSVESETHVFETAECLFKNKVKAIRGGAFKPRTSPYAFQGLGVEGLKYLRKAADQFGLAVVTELLHLETLDEVVRYADMIQVGARNMQNFEMLRRLGEIRKPVLLKRGMAATIEEFLLAAEYILAGGNDQVVLCERGIRTFETATRNTLDLNAVAYIREVSHLPIIVDPSHGTGRASLVAPLTRAAIAAGAAGVIIEIHKEPSKALSDGFQTLNFQQFEELLRSISLARSESDAR
ncbi:MAG: 3-deoxy-7-phosphoheptulonate synthase [Deltaproteobacteria bacterium]|nr:3-deoxy-7-phosphoheptulonate synthase [Deltaproteobacteria bacterium]MBI4197319.1 3-deoxy-7-phosphoheptulonate synthase [Deltaproteobacteria bacterium]